MDRITYDSDSKRWVDVLWGDGGAYGLSFSKGWNGDKIVWHDVAFAPGPDISSQTDHDDDESERHEAHVDVYVHRNQDGTPRQRLGGLHERLTP